MHMGIWPGYGRWVIGLLIIGGLAARFLQRKKSD
jgi:hypothetical protein